MNAENVIRKELSAFLAGGQAHIGFQAVAGFPESAYNTKTPNMDYTFWHLLEHIRRAQRDLLDFMINPNYEELQWPQDYWPDPASECTPDQWQETWQSIQSDLSTVRTMVSDPKIDLSAPLPYASGYTYLREFLLVGDHNAYHLGEFAIARGILGLWDSNSEG